MTRQHLFGCILNVIHVKMGFLWGKVERQGYTTPSSNYSWTLLVTSYPQHFANIWAPALHPLPFKVYHFQQFQPNSSLKKRNSNFLIQKSVLNWCHLKSLILPTCPEQNVRRVLGELVFRQTLTPMRNHLPNSPYITTYSWLSIQGSCLHLIGMQ